MNTTKYKRILLKLSGEAFQEEGKNISSKNLENIVEELNEIHQMGVEIAVVLGGGNFWRFRDFQDLNIERVLSDQTGMVATVMNALVLSSALQKKGIVQKTFSAFELEGLLPRYNIDEAKKSLGKGEIVILAGGTGSPFFTTDSAAALRSSELKVDVLLKSTKVEGVYDSDPEKNKDAKKFEELSCDEAMEKNLKVMDQTAFAMCKEGKIPIIVFDGFQRGNLKKIISGEKVGTLVR